MIFAAFFVFFPPFFRSPAGATTVTKCVPARPCEIRVEEEVKGQAAGGTYDGCAYDVSLSFALFLRVPRAICYLSLSDIRSFPALPLNININLRSTRKVLRSLVLLLSSSVFASSRFTVCVSALLPRVYTHTHREAIVHKRKTFAAHSLNVPPVKSIFSPDALFTAPGDKRIFDLGP